jgi:hypothetical protein
MNLFSMDWSLFCLKNTIVVVGEFSSNKNIIKKPEKFFGFRFYLPNAFSFSYSVNT